MRTFPRFLSSHELQPVIALFVAMLVAGVVLAAAVGCG